MEINERPAHKFEASALIRLAAMKPNTEEPLCAELPGALGYVKCLNDGTLIMMVSKTEQRLQYPFKPTLKRMRRALDILSEWVKEYCDNGWSSF